MVRKEMQQPTFVHRVVIFVCLRVEFDHRFGGIIFVQKHSWVVGDLGVVWKDSLDLGREPVVDCYHVDFVLFIQDRPGQLNIFALEITAVAAVWMVDQHQVHVRVILVFTRLLHLKGDSLARLLVREFGLEGLLAGQNLCDLAVLVRLENWRIVKEVLFGQSLQLKRSQVFVWKRVLGVLVLNFVVEFVRSALAVSEFLRALVEHRIESFGDVYFNVEAL